MTSLPPAEVLHLAEVRPEELRALDDGVFLVDAPSGPWVLKRSLDVDASTIEWEHRLLRELAAAGLTVQYPVPHLGGRSSIGVGGQQWVALSYLPGRPLRASGVVGHEMVGDLIASFHDVAATLGVPDSPSSEPLAATIRNLADDWSRLRFGTGAANRLRACRDQTLAELDSRIPTEPTLIVHGDLHVGNILVAPSPSRITGVIDFNLAHRAEAIVDLAFNLWWWCRPAVQQYVWAAAAGTLDGYCRRRALGNDAASWLVTLLKARGLMLLVRLRAHDAACEEIHATLQFVVEHAQDLASCVSEAVAGAG